ncbi:MAG: fibronectin type III domain-containing protein, partial [Pirellulales bacterium]|nr:fibronectin type III domain-containing protein [Pirellulales bacterium]
MAINASRFGFCINARLCTTYCCVLSLSILLQAAVCAEPSSSKLTVQDKVVAIPAREIPPLGKVVFTLAVDEKAKVEQVLLRFEAVLQYETEAGYAGAARLAVNGKTLDGSRYPANWKKQRTWSLPNLNSKSQPLFDAKAKAWTIRYDNDGYPPGKNSRYYSPELDEKYVYMFAIGELLNKGENRITVENLSKQYTLKLLPPATEKPGLIDDLRAIRVGDTSVELGWKSTLRSFEIDFRAAGEKNWQTIANVLDWENPYNVIALAPGTKYEFRLCGPFQPTADLHGKVPAVKNIESPIITAETHKTSPSRLFAGMKLLPTRPMPGGLGYYPCVESYGGFLWIIDGGLRLIKLD